MQIPCGNIKKAEQVMNNARITFFGTSKFSADILSSLKANFNIVAVVTQPDKPVGRKQEITPSPVAELAGTLNIPVLKPNTLKSSEAFEQIKALNSDLFVVVAYGKIIPQNILDLAAKGPINIHGSLLPKYRGASPIHAALLNGEKETGITIMLMDSEMDHGPILLMRALDIAPDDTFIELEDKMSVLAQDLINEAIPKYLSGELKPQEQNHSEATFTKIIAKEDGKIDWNNKAEDIYNKYRAYVVWPGIWTTFNGKVFKIKKCGLSPHQTDIPAGTVFEKDGSVLVQTGSGSLELIEVQVEGKNPVVVKDFILGNKDFLGSKLV
jgi:methionyl-tRNA formyltransferase